MSLYNLTVYMFMVTCFRKVENWCKDINSENNVCKMNVILSWTLLYHTWATWAPKQKRKRQDYLLCPEVQQFYGGLSYVRLWSENGTLLSLESECTVWCSLKWHFTTMMRPLADQWVSVMKFSIVFHMTRLVPLYLPGKCFYKTNKVCLRQIMNSYVYWSKNRWCLMSGWSVVSNLPV